MSKVDALITVASTELGKPYVYGAEGPTNFDCSGLMQYIFGQIGIKLPRTAAEQQAWATPVSNPLPGDLVFYGRPAHHVGLYIGAGKMISAPGPGLYVHTVAVGTPTSYGRVAGLGTVLAPAVGVLTTAGGAVLSAAGGLLGGARSIVVEGLAVIAGLGLVLAGGWYLTRNRSPADLVKGLL